MALGLPDAALPAAAVCCRMNCLILASGSPRRKELLTQIGVSFVIDVPNIDESIITGESPENYVSRLSKEKVMQVAERNQGSVVLAADTTVVSGETILGKPASRSDGMRMLQNLSGSVHSVLTGVSVWAGETTTICTTSLVRFRELCQQEIEWYWETGEPADKAGGYGLQGIGAAFVSSIEGSYSNVIGLPLTETVELLRDHGVNCLGVGDKRFSNTQGARNV